MASTVRGSASYGAWIMVIASAIGLALSIYNYFTLGNGINHSAGALLVLVSSALILGASVLLALYRSRPGWLRVLLDILLVLGILGTGFAAYFLEAYWLLGLMVIALIGWLVEVFRGSDRTRARSVSAPAGAM